MQIMLGFEIMISRLDEAVAFFFLLLNTQINKTQNYV